MWLFEGNQNTDVTLGENKFDTPALDKDIRIPGMAKIS